LPEPRDITAPLLPSREHVGSIGIEDTASLASTFASWTSATLAPALDSAHGYSQSAGNLPLGNPALLEVDHLLKSLLIVRQPCQSLVLGVLVTRLPPLVGFGKSRKRKWSLSLTELFVAVSDQWFDGLDQILGEVKAVCDWGRLGSPFACGLCIVVATITDHGDVNLGGQNLRHFTIAFGKDSLQDFLNATGALNASSLQQQQLDLLLKGITLQRASLDAWIDESTSYVHRIDLKFVISVDLNAIGGTATPGSSSSGIPPTTTSVETTIDYSKFNVPVTIQAPANATPTSDLLRIFQ
jgi:hypothetical protein